MKSFWQRAPRHKRFYKGPARSKKYLAWIRTLPCLICGQKAEASHTGKDGGASLKASDFSAVPLCQNCHTQAGKAYHRGTREQFEQRYGLDIEAITKELKAHYERKTMPYYETHGLRHQELLLLNTFVTESAAEVEQSLNETPSDSSDPDWQFLRGQESALKEVAKKIREIASAADLRFDRMKPAGEVKSEEAA